LGFEPTFIDKLIGRMEQNQAIFEKILGDEAFGSVVKEFMVKRVYQRLNHDEAA
jgi:type I restriction enzyme R subunit